MTINKKNLLITDILASNIIYFKQPHSSKMPSNASKSKYLILKIAYVITAIKQFLRLIQFQSRTYGHGLQMNVKGIFYQELISQLFKEFFSLSTKEYFTYGNMNRKIRIYKKLFLDLDITTKLSLKNIRWYNSKKVFILVIFNTWLNYYATGVFQNALKINNYLPIIFLFLLIGQTTSIYSSKKLKKRKKYAIKFKI